MVKTGSDAVPLRLRMPYARMKEVVDAVGREAAAQRPSASAASE